MKWHKKLYLGEAVKNNKSKIISDLEKHKLMLGVYLICIADNSKDLFDIIPAFMLFNENNFNKEYVGVAFTKDEAFDLVKQIIDDVIKETNSFDVRSYFE